MTQTVTVVPTDNLIIINGSPLTFSYTPPYAIKALHWDGESGNIELLNGEHKPLSATNYTREVLPYIALYEAEKHRLANLPPEPEPELSFEALQAEAFEKLRNRKWAAKNGGITANGIAIDTDDTGQATITGAVLNVLLNPEFKAKWKTASSNPDGTAIWVEIDKPVILMLADALTAHTEACFAEEEIKQRELSQLTTTQQIKDWLENELGKGWPNDN